jgi:hypothetical protein
MGLSVLCGTELIERHWYIVREREPQRGIKTKLCHFNVTSDFPQGCSHKGYRHVENLKPRMKTAVSPIPNS